MRFFYGKKGPMVRTNIITNDVITPPENVKNDLRFLIIIVGGWNVMEEKRRMARVNTHLVTRMTMVASELNESRHIYGYIENISESGIKIASLDLIGPQTRLSCCFYLNPAENKLNPLGTVIYRNSAVDMVYYFGLHFDYISTRERELIQEFIEKMKKV